MSKSMMDEKSPLIPIPEVPSKDSSEKGGGKQIHLLSSISVTLSMMTGVGIFIFPNLVLQGVQSGGASLLVWAAAGVVAVLSGLCYSELALALPGSGGELVYIQRVYGKTPANIFLLTSAFVKYPAISVILAHTSFTYFMKSVDSSVNLSEHTWALCVSGICITAVACLVACLSTKLCTLLINALNFCKLAGIATIISFAIFVAVKSPDKQEIGARFSLHNTTTHVPTILVSLFGSIASYEGWNSLNLVAGEVYDPQRTMPIAITVASCLAIVFYICCNVAYLTVLPLDVMKNSNAVAMDLGRLALGKCGETFLTVCVIASCLATILALVLCNSRLIQRAARDGQVPELFKFTLISRATPLFAILLHGITCSIFSLVTSLEALTTIIVLVSWVFYFLCFIAIPILRYRDKMNPKFKVPVAIPAVLCLFSILLMLAPATTSQGSYRASFIVTLILLVILTPVSLLSTSPALEKYNPFVKLSGRLTDYIAKGGSFS